MTLTVVITPDTRHSGLKMATGNVGTKRPHSEEKEEPVLVVGRSVKARLYEQINSGSFGAICRGRLVDDDTVVAIKMELQKTSQPQLLFEANVLQQLEGGPGIPKVHWFGLHEPTYNVMIMEMLNFSLQEAFSYCDHHFSLKTVLMIVDQVVEILEYVHSHQYVHRDIKPDNFMIGNGARANRIFIIDFGLSKKYKSRLFGHSHIPLVHGLVGTVRYCSLTAHMGREETFRDDMEAVCYMLAYFLRGSLPWQNLQGVNKMEIFRKIKEVKIATSIRMLFDKHPPQFATYLKYIRSLSQDELPKYTPIRQMFQELAKEKCISYDYRYDWVEQQERTGLPVAAKSSESKGHREH